jgi:hypothetical protein
VEEKFYLYVFTKDNVFLARSEPKTAAEIVADVKLLFKMVNGNNELCIETIYITTLDEVNVFKYYDREGITIPTLLQVEEWKQNNNAAAMFEVFLPGYIEKDRRLILSFGCYSERSEWLPLKVLANFNVHSELLIFKLDLDPLDQERLGLFVEYLIEKKLVISQDNKYDCIHLGNYHLGDNLKG